MITNYREPQVAVGYIPKRRHGNPSYPPILSSEGRVGLSLGADLRAGNIHSATGARPFLERILAKRVDLGRSGTRRQIRTSGAPAY